MFSSPVLRVDLVALWAAVAAAACVDVVSLGVCPLPRRPRRPWPLELARRFWTPQPSRRRRSPRPRRRRSPRRRRAAPRARRRRPRGPGPAGGRPTGCNLGPWLVVVSPRRPALLRPLPLLPWAVVEVVVVEVGVEIEVRIYIMERLCYNILNYDGILYKTIIYTRFKRIARLV